VFRHTGVGRRNWQTARTSSSPMKTAKPPTATELVTISRISILVEKFPDNFVSLTKLLDKNKPNEILDLRIKIS
jgi:hypothetical protein